MSIRCLLLLKFSETTPKLCKPLKCTWGPVWPDDGIKSCPIFFQYRPKSSNITFYMKVVLFEIAQKILEYLGYYCNKIRYQEVLKNNPIWSHWWGLRQEMMDASLRSSLNTNSLWKSNHDGDQCDQIESYSWQIFLHKLHKWLLIFLGYFEKHIFEVKLLWSLFRQLMK